ncbi:hypothetical protein GCM10010245_66490 [Streptomyces spectabilis]|uniref:Uncharacterized protein n=1 Tax=Streptomyces spectabilis TaxID=68270 RepID=A0A5P2X2K7_STRST|nr:hypothetical protein [Streptomyces spectabilis]QEV57519.1 hypothetical protein CP982_01240 [Streptomyces spectabilis]GGV42391.1 hypothetical protein GCM10010245_66490 [Streptomyces spectabilis]
MVAELVLGGDLEEVLSLRAIMCVTRPDVLHYTRAVTRSVSVLPDTGPAVLWGDAKAPEHRTATVEALYRGLNLDGIHEPRLRHLRHHPGPVPGLIRRAAGTVC